MTPNDRLFGGIAGVLTLVALDGWNAIALVILTVGPASASAIVPLLLIATSLWVGYRVVRGWDWGGYAVLILLAVSFGWWGIGESLGWTYLGLPRPGTTVTPTVIGVIDAAHRNAEGMPVLSVAGQEITIDQSSDRQLAGSLAMLDAGNLLILGTTPGRWYLTLAEDHPGCFRMAADGAFDDPDGVSVVFVEWKRDVGILLKRAASFHPTASLVLDGRYYGQSEGPDFNFCLNAAGEVTGAYP